MHLRRAFPFTVRSLAWTSSILVLLRQPLLTTRRPAIGLERFPSQPQRLYVFCWLPCIFVKTRLSALHSERVKLLYLCQRSQVSSSVWLLADSSNNCARFILHLAVQIRAGWISAYGILRCGVPDHVTRFSDTKIPSNLMGSGIRTRRVVICMPAPRKR